MVSRIYHLEFSDQSECTITGTHYNYTTLNRILFTLWYEWWSDNSFKINKRATKFIRHTKILVSSQWDFFFKFVFHGCILKHFNFPWPDEFQSIFWCWEVQISCFWNSPELENPLPSLKEAYLPTLPTYLRPQYPPTLTEIFYRFFMVKGIINKVRKSNNENKS